MSGRRRCPYVERVLPVAVFVAAAIVGVVAVPLDLAGWAAMEIVLAAYYLAVSSGREIVVVAVLATATGFTGVASLVAPGWWTGLGPMALAAMRRKWQIHPAETRRPRATSYVPRLRRHDVPALEAVENLVRVYHGLGEPRPW
jgi:hypothetical protein